MTILLHKTYYVKVTTKGEGVENSQKIDHVVWFMNNPLIHGSPLQGNNFFAQN